MLTRRNDTSTIALDVGHKRIGVAIAHNEVRLARPLITLENPDSFITDIQQICEQESVDCIVVGLPRNLGSQDTDQTSSVRSFAYLLEESLELPLQWMDEALTSQKAEDELDKRGKPYKKSDVDALAATFILEDYLRENTEKIHV